jgi:hypothetical protein
MELEELINGGWGRHEAETEAVAQELEEHVGLVKDPGHAAAFSALASHAVGEHLGEWSRAARLIEAAVKGLQDDAALTSSLILLGVSLEFGEDTDGAAAAFDRARALAGDDAVFAVRTHLARASAYMGVGTTADLLREHQSAMEVISEMPDTASVDRLVAIISNNAASHLMEQEELSREEADGMLRIAGTAKECWTRAGDWVNHERADYLMALVYNRISEWGEGLAAADAGLTTIAENGEEEIDEAFLQLARSQALRGLGEESACEEALKVADAYAEDWTEGLRAWYDSQRERSLEAPPWRPA